MLEDVMGIDAVLKMMNIKNTILRLESEEEKLDEKIHKEIEDIRELCGNECSKSESIKSIIKQLMVRCGTSNDNKCEEFARWKTNSKLLKVLYQQLPKLSKLPANGWLSNEDIDEFLELFKICFNKFEYFETTTSDFMFCDFKTDQTNADYPILMQEYANINHKYDPELLNSKGFKELSHLNRKNIETMIDNGITCFAVVLNTDRCDQPGEHWVCFFVDIADGRIDFFNSTGPGYGKNLKMLKKYLDYLKDEIKTCGIDTFVTYNEHSVQSADGTCGVYCLLFVLCRIIDIHPDEIIEGLSGRENMSDSIVNQFKEVIFMH